MRKGKWLLLASFAVLLVSLIYFYLFREVHREHGHLGYMAYKYRWGRPYEMISDQNRDGTPDARHIVAGTFQNIPPLESWVDADFTGNYTVHVINKPGGPRIVEIDDDADGKYDRRLAGQEAQDFLYELGQKRSAIIRDRPIQGHLEDVNRPPSSKEPGEAF